MTAPATKQAQPAAKQAGTPAPAKAARAPLTEAQKVQRNKDRAAKFSELARKRLGKVLLGMKHLENLGRGQYVYTPQQAEKVLQYLVDGIGKVKVAFAARGSKAAQELPEI